MVPSVSALSARITIKVGQTVTIPVNNPKPRKQEQYVGCRFVQNGNTYISGRSR
jgi:hypothetical protein